MSEETTTEPKITVHFERKQDLGNYHNTVASAFLTLPLDDTSPAAVNKATIDALNLVKAAVLDHLGIEVIVDDAGIVREAHIPVAVTAATTGTSNLRRQTGATGGWDDKGLKVNGKAEDWQMDVPDEVAAYCEKYGITGVWANQGKHGQFFKEFVPKGEDPKGETDDEGRTIIIPFKRK